ncbi:hypothetical protein [Fortiea contorta]|uniref:hypothetical protein n=1 Tax=Fortiea contorta TaxID=1892405 RepID=UPI0003720A03|nr:hypothetical protein [Fortiea contorta]
MNNSQNVQHKTTKIARASLDLTDSSQIMMYLLTRNPWLLLVGLLTMFLGSAAFALHSLGYVGYVPQPEEPDQVPEAPTVFEQSSNTSSEITNPIPLWMIAAIALSCSSGCLIICRLIHQSTQHQKFKKPPKRYQTPLASSHQSRLKPQTPKPPQILSSISTLSPLASLQTQTKPLVTVLPIEQTSGLNHNQASLVELLDIRKQNTLSAILRKY